MNFFVNFEQHVPIMEMMKFCPTCGKEFEKVDGGTDRKITKWCREDHTHVVWWYDDRAGWMLKVETVELRKIEDTVDPDFYVEALT